MPNYKRLIIVIALVAVTAVASFTAPKIKYKSTSIIPRLNIPTGLKEWRGKDISSQFNTKDEKYNFVGDIFAHAYRNYLGEIVLLLILDAGNFHNPKVCLGSAGYTAKDLPDTELKTLHGSFKAHTVFFDKKDEGLLVIYWICIDKKLTDWAGQKLVQFFYSMFNKEKIGLMVRMDIPTKKGSIQSSISAAKEFILDLSNNLPEGQSEYLFGK